jgi:hypothetical protein
VPHDSLRSDTVPACSACDLIDCLANPGPCGRRGGFCTCLRATSRVIWPVFTPGRCPYIDSRVSLTGALGLHRGRRGGVTSEQDSTSSVVPPQCRAWLHSAGDGHTREEVTEKMCSAHLASSHRPGRPLGHHSYALEGVLMLSRGAQHGGRTRAGSTVLGNDPGLSAQ